MSTDVDMETSGERAAESVTEVAPPAQPPAPTSTALAPFAEGPMAGFACLMRAMWDMASTLNGAVGDDPPDWVAAAGEAATWSTMGSRRSTRRGS